MSSDFRASYYGEKEQTTCYGVSYWAKDVGSPAQCKLLYEDNLWAETCLVSQEGKGWGKCIRSRGNVDDKVLSIKRLVSLRKKIRASEAKALLNTQGRSRRHNRKRDKPWGLCRVGRSLRHSGTRLRGLVCRERRDEYERFQRVTSQHEHNKYSFC